jgi:hypothetical protein
MISRNKDWFVKSGYWRNVARVLERMGGTYENQIEVSVSPVNSDDLGWSTIGQVRIRRHVTIDARDVFSHHFPDYLERELEERFGKGIANALLHEDLLKEIDPFKHRVMARQWVWGGGIPFVLIAREPHKFPALIQFWIDHPVEDRQQALFLPLIEEHEERMKQPVLNNVPREWVESYYRWMSNMQPGDPTTDEIRRFLENNPVEVLGFPPIVIIKDE